MASEADIQEIWQLPHLYCDAVARRDWDALAAVYAYDAVWEVPDNGIRISGRAEIRRWVEDMFKGSDFFIQLIGAQRLVRVEDEFAASHTYFQAFSRRLDGSGFHYMMVYDDELRRGAGGWEFSHRLGYFLYRDNHAPTGVNVPLPALRRCSPAEPPLRKDVG